MQFLKGSRNNDETSEINEDDTREKYRVKSSTNSTTMSQATTDAAVMYIKCETVECNEDSPGSPAPMYRDTTVRDPAPRKSRNFYTCPLCVITYKSKMGLQLHAYRYHNIDLREMLRGFPKITSPWTDGMSITARIEDGRQLWSVIDEFGEKFEEATGGRHDAKNRHMYTCANRTRPQETKKRRRVYGYNGTSEESNSDNSEDESNNENSPDERKNESLNSRKSSTISAIKEAEKNLPIPIVRIERIPLNFNLAIKNRIDIYHCDTCGEQYKSKRELRCHMEKNHGLTMSEKEATTRNEEKKAEDDESTKKEENIDAPVYTCPMCTNTYNWKFSLQVHARNHHDVDVSELFRGLPKRANEKSRKMVIAAYENNGKYDWSITNEYGERVMDVAGQKNGNAYRFKCPDCDKTFRIKNSMRRHAYVFHKIVVLQRWTRDMTRAATTKISLTSLSSSTSTSSMKSGNAEKPGNLKSYAMKNNAKRKNIRLSWRNKNSKLKSVQSINELMRKEESMLRESLADEKPRETEKCFLCHNDFIELKRHLKDYHRVNSPETVLPLTRRIVVDKDKSANMEKAVKVEKIDLHNEDCEPIKSKKSRWRDFFVVRRITKNGEKRRVHECLTCSFQYSTIGGVRRHLKRYVVNDVIKDHEAFIPGSKVDQLYNRIMRLRERKKSSERITVDPLAIDDIDDCANNDDDDIVSKRCKIDDTSVKEEINDDENFMRENIIKSDDNHVDSRDYDVNDNDDNDDDDDDGAAEDFEDEDRAPSLRDNSDQDSGISFTINNPNWYKVVNRDTRIDDYKGNVIEDSKNLEPALLSSNSSMEITNTMSIKNNVKENSTTTTTSRIYCRRDEDLIDFSRKPEISKTLNRQEKSTISAVKIVDEIVIDNDDKVDHIDINDDTKVFVQSNVKVGKFCRKDEQRVRPFDKSADNVIGKVSSSNVSSNNATKRDEIKDVVGKNNHALHQCPVCRKHYNTERDVTVHMLEHKISRKNFRTARLRSIPISALRRYPNKKV